MKQPRLVLVDFDARVGPANDVVVDRAGQQHHDPHAAPGRLALTAAVTMDTNGVSVNASVPVPVGDLPICEQDDEDDKGHKNEKDRRGEKGENNQKGQKKDR